MFQFARTPLLLAALATSLVACAIDEGDTGAPLTPGEEAAVDEPLRTAQVLDPLFAEAAEAYDVPEPLLKAIAHAQTRWQMVMGEEEFEGLSQAYGLMALRGEAVEEGAALTGAAADAVRTDPLANLMAGAALLAAHADELDIAHDRRADLGAWAPAVARMSGLEDQDAQAHYIHEEVYAVLRQGAEAYTTGDELAVSLAPAKVTADFAVPERDKAAGPDYPASIWRPSPNYNSRPSGAIGDPSMIVIHTCEGNYSGCWSWLVNPSSGVSAHYVVNESGSEISQLVRESHRAFHVGATYNCNLNGGVQCSKNGYSVNHFSVGIEHGGFASQSSFPLGQIDASAKLSCDISRDQGIPRDRFHIVAHGTLQPYNRTDPGPNWPWTDYLNRVNNHCSSGGGGGSLIIDSNNNNNDTSKGYIQVSGNWTSSTNVPGYYGTGYYWASTQAISDGASFWFYLPTAGTKTIDAWWTAASDRSTSAPFVFFNASGTNLGTVSKNQQVGGSQWNTLGTFSFQAGWNRVMLSRWTGTGSVVIADAVRVR